MQSVHRTELSVDQLIAEFRRLFLLNAAQTELMEDKLEINAIINNIKKVTLSDDTLLGYMKTLVRLSVHHENVSVMVIRPLGYMYFWLTYTRMYLRAPDNGDLCCMIWTLIRNMSKLEDMRDTLVRSSIVCDIILYMQDDRLVVDHVRQVLWCEVLKNISEGYRHCDHIASSGGIEALLYMMPRYIHARELQKEACLVLYNLCHRLADDHVSEILDIKRIREMVARDAITIVEAAGKTFVCGVRLAADNYARAAHYNLLNILRQRRDADEVADIWR